MKFYRARFNEIVEVEVEKETDKFVVLEGGRSEAKDSDWQWYRREREQAKIAQIARREHQRDVAKKQLEYAEAQLAKAQNA